MSQIHRSTLPRFGNPNFLSLDPYEPCGDDVDVVVMYPDVGDEDLGNDIRVEQLPLMESAVPLVAAVPPLPPPPLQLLSLRSDADSETGTKKESSIHSSGGSSHIFLFSMQNYLSCDSLGWAGMVRCHWNLFEPMTLFV